MKKILGIIFGFISLASFGQTCPTNLSFDANNLSFWEFKTGTYTGNYIGTYGTGINPIPSKASTVTTANDNSNINSFTIFKANADGTLVSDEKEPSIKKVPEINGYKYQNSVRLGNSSTGAKADKLTYRLTVPTGLSTYNITYAYAVILQDPGHPASQQPAFAATVSDLSQPLANQVITCASKKYYSNNTLPTCRNDAGARYIAWQEVSFDLSQYAGKVIELKFEAFDCSAGGHYGYAYLAFRNDGCGTGAISGNSLICNSSTSLTYSTPNVDGASFTWTLPYGWTGTSTTNSITVNPNGNSGGNITVTPSQSCGNITTRSLSVTTVNSIPSTPGTIVGDNTICSSSTNLTYSVPEVSNASSYTWTYPTGWTIVSGLNTNVITFNASSSSGNITVKSNNLCGSSSVSTSSISVVSNPLSSAGAISGVPPSILCASQFPKTLTLGTSVGNVTKWLYSEDGGITYLNIDNTTSTLSITPSKSTFYKAEVKNGVCAPAQSAAVLVNVYSEIQIINQPTSINTCAGSAKTFSVTASGDGTLTYNWQVSTNGSTWTNISASPTNYTNYTTATLTVGAALVTSGANYQYRCVISSSTNCSPVTSDVATLTVSNSVTPVITTSPTDKTVCTGASSFIEVAATGPSLTYQWQSAASLNGTYSNISGQTATKLTLNTASATTYYYKCVITEACGGLNASTTPVTISIVGSTTASVTITSDKNNVCAGTLITYSTTSNNGGTSPTYTWYKNNQVISGQNQATYASTDIANNDVVYAVMTSNKACAIGSPASSNNITTGILAAPSITSVTNASRCGTGSLSLGAAASSGTISWYSAASGGSAISTGTSYNTGTISSTQTYYVDASNGTCTTASRSAVVATISSLNISFTGNATDYDLVSLTASGGNTYSWDGGNSLNTAANTFDESGTYQVTVSDATGCSGTQSVVVTVKLRGLSRYGQLLDIKNSQVNRFGQEASDFPIINSGQNKKYSPFKISTSNLALHLNASNNASYSGTGNTWTDLSANAWATTLTNGVTYSNRFGGVMVFDGINDYVSMPSNYAGSNDMSIETWIYPSQVTGNQSILTMDNNISGNIQLLLSNNQVQFNLNGESSKSANTTLKSNKWYHLVVVVNRTAKTVNFYVNGQLTNTETYVNPPAIASQPLKLGTWSNNATLQQFYNGYIGLVRLYNTAITSNQVSINFNNGRLNFGQ